MAGPYFIFSNSSFPVQGGVPVLITQAEFEACCCGARGVSPNVRSLQLPRIEKGKASRTPPVACCGGKITEAGE
jgi:hypothetical protein